MQILEVEDPFGHATEEPRHPVLEHLPARAEQVRRRIEHLPQREEIGFGPAGAVQEEEGALSPRSRDPLMGEPREVGGGRHHRRVAGRAVALGAGEQSRVRPEGEHAHRGHTVEQGEFRREIRLPLLRDPILRWPFAHRGPFTVAGVERIDDLESRDDLPDRGESHPVESGVVPQIDEELRGARVPAPHRIGHGPPAIRRHDGIVGDAARKPGGGARRVGGEPPLHHEAGQDAEEAPTIVVGVEHERPQLRRAAGGPRRAHQEVHRALGGLDPHEEGVGGGEHRGGDRWRGRWDRRPSEGRAPRRTDEEQGRAEERPDVDVGDHRMFGAWMRRSVRRRAIAPLR